MDKEKQKLKNLYDVINKIARQHEAKGEDISNWFYSRKANAFICSKCAVYRTIALKQ